MRSRISVMMAALWWGSLTALGFVVVPMLFANLSSPAVAGAMAAKLFTAQTWIGTACALLILSSVNQKEPQAHIPKARAAIKFVVAGLLLALLVEFAIAPRIVSARAEGASLRMWHGLGSAMYLAQWIFAGLSLWRLTERAAPAVTPEDFAPLPD